MTISERVEAGRRERRVLARVSRARWRLRLYTERATLILYPSSAVPPSAESWNR